MGQRVRLGGAEHATTFLENEMENLVLTAATEGRSFNGGHFGITKRLDGTECLGFRPEFLENGVAKIGEMAIQVEAHPLDNDSILVVDHRSSSDAFLENESVDASLNGEESKCLCGSIDIDEDEVTLMLCTKECVHGCSRLAIGGRANVCQVAVWR